MSYSKWVLGMALVSIVCHYAGLREVDAGQLHCRSLQEVIPNVKRALVVKILDQKQGATFVYQVEVKRNLWGTERIRRSQFSFSYPQAECKQADGTTVVKSIIADCSGHEHEPKVGQEWIFLSSSSSGENLMRIEPLSREQEITHLLGQIYRKRD